MTDFIGIIVATLSIFAIYAILALSLNLEFGFGGQFNLGKVFFFGIGAFSAAEVVAYGTQIATGTYAPICSGGAVIGRTSILMSDPGLGYILFAISLLIGGITAAVMGYVFLSLLCAFETIFISV